MSQTQRSRVEVFADISCPFAHVGLRVAAQRAKDRGLAVDWVVRAWPLEWVNEQPLKGVDVSPKVQALRQQLGPDHFASFNPNTFPTSTISALNLVAMGYEVDNQSGLSLSLDIRRALFEDGADLSTALEGLATSYGLPAPPAEPLPAVLNDFDAGKERGVVGSPHFYSGRSDFFCPSLSLSKDASGHLVAEIDHAGLTDFLDAI